MSEGDAESGLVGRSFYEIMDALQRLERYEPERAQEHRRTFRESLIECRTTLFGRMEFLHSELSAIVDQLAAVDRYLSLLNATIEDLPG